MNGPFSRIVDAVAEIAKNLGGAISQPTGNRLADNLEVIANKAKTIPSGDSLPAVTAANNGKVLKVVEGAWALGDDNQQVLPMPPETAGNYVLGLHEVDGFPALYWKEDEADATPGG